MADRKGTWFYYKGIESFFPYSIAQALQIEMESNLPKPKQSEQQNNSFLAQEAQLLQQGLR